MPNEWFKLAPGIVGILFVVIAFLKYMKDENKRREKIESTQMANLKAIGDNCHKHARELNERACKSIDDAVKVNEKTLEALGSIGELMRGCADRANGKGKS